MKKKDCDCEQDPAATWPAAFWIAAIWLSVGWMVMSISQCMAK